MSGHEPDHAPPLHVVPDAAAEAGDPGEAAPDTDASADDAGRDPLLDRAERIADLPLAERPAAFDGLNRAVATELQALEEG